jgi:hypothetical protein
MELALVIEGEPAAVEPDGVRAYLQDHDEELAAGVSRKALNTLESGLKDHRNNNIEVRRAKSIEMG